MLLKSDWMDEVRAGRMTMKEYNVLEAAFEPYAFHWPVEFGIDIGAFYIKMMILP